MSQISLLHHRCSSHQWAALAALLTLGTLLAAPFSTYSAEIGVSFDEAGRLAVEQAPLLKARQSQVEAKQEEAVRAAALPDPKLTLGLVNWPATGREAFDLRADDMTMKQIGVMQEFPARAKRRARQALADRDVEQAQAMSEAEQLAVRQAVAIAWITLWAAQREVTELQTLREPAALAVRTAKARLSGASGTVTDTLATQAAALELENRLDGAEAALEAARAGLARWLGTAAAGTRTKGGPPQLTEMPFDEAELLASIDHQGPLLPWRSREALALAEMDSAIAEKLPDWSVGVTYGQRERTPEGMARSDMLMVEFAIDLPLFTRNRQDRGIAARRAELQAVAAEREDARRAQGESVRRDFSVWQGLRRQVDRKQTQSLPLARDRARTALGAYAGGGDLQPWLQARRDEIELHLELARQLGELGRAWAALAYLLPEKETSP